MFSLTGGYTVPTLNQSNKAVLKAEEYGFPETTCEMSSILNFFVSLTIFKVGKLTWLDAGMDRYQPFRKDRQGR